jgi:transcriptional regulator with XRE-family HTH domain
VASSDVERKESNVLVELGSRLEERRRKLQKSARETAKAAGISAVYLRVIETGRNAKTGRASRPSPEVLVRLARELELSPDELLASAGYDDLRVDLDAPPQSPLSAALESDLERTLHGIVEAVGLVQTRPSDFMRAVMKENLAAFEANAHAIATGSFLATPDVDPRMRRQALETSCSTSLQAVSFDDDLWWLGAQGQRFAELHIAISQRHPGLHMCRLFLLGADALTGYREVLAVLSNAGVELRIADPGDVPESSRRDFEIFDASLLREATSRGHGHETLRFADYIDDHARLQRAESAFAVAWSRATVFDS